MIKIFESNFGLEEENAVQEVIKSSWLATGSIKKKKEKAITELTQPHPIH